MAEKPVKYYKLTNFEMRNRGLQLVLGLNQELTFDTNTSRECSQGLYFCTLEYVAYWSQLGYSHVVDVGIPVEAKVIHFSNKSRADKLILSNLRPLLEMYDQLPHPLSDGEVKFLLNLAIHANNLPVITDLLEKYRRFIASYSMENALLHGSIEAITIYIGMGIYPTKSSMGTLWNFFHEKHDKVMELLTGVALE